MKKKHLMKGEFSVLQCTVHISLIFSRLPLGLILGKKEFDKTGNILLENHNFLEQKR